MDESEFPDGSKILLSPIALFNKIESVLERVGPEAFFRSSNEEVKTAREGLAILFYVSNLSQGSGKFWWIRQVGKYEEFPDFHILMIDENPLSFSFEGIELVEIPPRILNYEDALTIVNKKLNKGYPPGYDLLIFVNNENSTSWIPRLNLEIQFQKSFKIISTVHLLAKPGTQDINKIIVQKLYPVFLERIETNFNDLLTRLPDWPKNLFDKIEVSNQTGVKIKPEVMEELRKTIRSLTHPNRSARRAAMRKKP